MWTALVRAFGRGWAFAGVVKLVHDILNLSSPYILRQLLIHKQEGYGRFSGLAWAAALFVAGLSVAVLVNDYFLRVFNCSLFLKAGLIQALYAKSLRISIPAKTALGGGSIANLQSNDAAKIWGLPNYGHVLWSGPLQVFVIIFLLHNIIGWQSALAGLAVTVALVPLNAVVGKVVHKFRKELIARTDTRVKLVSEVINGVPSPRTRCLPRREMPAVHFRKQRPGSEQAVSTGHTAGLQQHKQGLQLSLIHIPSPRD